MSETSSSAASIFTVSTLPREILLFTFAERLWGVDVGRVVRLVQADYVSAVPLPLTRLAGVMKYEGQAVPIFVPPEVERPPLADWKAAPEHLVVLLEHETGLIGCALTVVERIARGNEFMFEGSEELDDASGEDEVALATGYFFRQHLPGVRTEEPEGRPFTFLPVSSILEH